MGGWWPGWGGRGEPALPADWLAGARPGQGAGRGGRGRPPLPRPLPAAPPALRGPVCGPVRELPAFQPRLRNGREGPGLQSQTVGMAMASVRIRQAEEGDCGNILKLIRVTAAGRKPGARRGAPAAWPRVGAGRPGCSGRGAPGEGAALIQPLSPRRDPLP